MIKEKAYIIHVRGNKKREVHIREQLVGTAFDYEFINDGNVEDLSEERLSEYFDGGLLRAVPTTSCAFKHLLAYEHMVKNGIPRACIIEDDIAFTDNFSEIFAKSLSEITRAQLYRFFISYERSLSFFVKRSEEKKDTVLYKRGVTRCTGFYMIDLYAAKLMLDRAKREKLSVPIDWWHNELVKSDELSVFWCHPAIAWQLSHNGKLASMIDSKSHGPVRVASYHVKLLYKRIRQMLG